MFGLEASPLAWKTRTHGRAGVLDTGYFQRRIVPSAIVNCMSSFEEVLDQLRKNQPQGKYGIALEKLMVNFLPHRPDLGGAV